MYLRRHAHSLFVMLAGILLLPLIFSSCQIALPTRVSPVKVDVAAENAASDGTTLEPVTSRPTAPPTWTPTPTSARDFPPTRTPVPTANYQETRMAMTVIAEGISCKRAPESWKVFVIPAVGLAGWCHVVGTQGTIYEYRLTAPDGWIVRTFGEIHPNLAFSTGMKNVHVRLYQAFSYHARSYTGTLEDAPEKAFRCDKDKNCQGYISPHETLVRQVIEPRGDREILVLDSTAGDLMIRRYYQILPFKSKNHESKRLFILEFTWLKSALDDEGYAETLKKIDAINQSLWQR